MTFTLDLEKYTTIMTLVFKIFFPVKKEQISVWARSLEDIVPPQHPAIPGSIPDGDAIKMVSVKIQNRSVIYVYICHDQKGLIPCY